MAGFGVPELIIIFLIIIVLFGSSRLPQLGSGLGKGISNFKKGLKSGDQESLSEAEQKQEAAAE